MSNAEWGLFEWGLGEWGSSVSADAGGLTRDESIPIDSSRTLASTQSIPIDSRGVIVLVLECSIPIDSPGGPTTRKTLDSNIPVESEGLDANLFLLQWSVRQRLITPFLLSWNVVQTGLVATFQLRWTVRQRTTPFILRWNVRPNTLSPLIANDVQMPFGTIEKTQAP